MLGQPRRPSAGIKITQLHRLAFSGSPPKKSKSYITPPPLQEHAPSPSAPGTDFVSGFVVRAEIAEGPEWCATKTTSYELFTSYHDAQVLLGLCPSFSVSIATQQTQTICRTFVQRRPNVFDVGPTLYKCYTNVLCLLG